MNDLTISGTNTIAAPRTVELVTLEIKTLHKQAQGLLMSYAIEIGRRLVEVKELLPHGEWGEYLKTQVEYSQSTANDLMRMYREYGASQQSLFGAEANSQTLGNLPYSKALALLAIPQEEREEFVEENDVDSISTRKLKEIIRERDEAQKRTEELEKKTADLTATLESAETERDNVCSEISRLEQELEELSNRPVDVAVETDNAALEAARTEAAEAARKETEAQLNERLKKAREAKEKADEKLKEAENRLKAKELESDQAMEKIRSEYKDRIDSLEKRLSVAGNQDVTTFKFYFDAAQEDFNRMLGCLAKIKSSSDTENHDKLTAATNALLKKCMEAI